MLEGTYDGTLFPRNITKGEKFRLYRKAFCRTLPIEYTHPGKDINLWLTLYVLIILGLFYTIGTVDGVDGYFFKLADNAFDTDLDDPTSACFCKQNKCLRKGLGDITPCYYSEYFCFTLNTPIVVKRAK